MGLRTIAALAVLGMLPALAPAMTAEELVAKNIEARGGLAALQALKSVRYTGKMIFGGGFELSYLMYQERPARLRMEFTLQGLTGIQSYDGREAWAVMPFQGRKDPDRLPPDAAKGLIETADLDGPLVDWQAKGHQLRYAGIEDVDGTEAHKLEVTLKGGDVKTYYFDPDYFLAIRETTRRSVRGAEVEEETDLGDYEKVNGVYLPFALETGPKGGEKAQKIIVDQAEANVEINDALFAFPAAVPPASKP